MKKISEGLWQVGILFDEEGLPEEADTVFWMIDNTGSVAGSLIFVRYPIPDNDQGLDDEVFLCLWGLVQALANRKVVAVCQAGENRSGLVATMILIARGEKVEDAIATVQKNGNARTHKHSFWNPGFVAQVRRLLGS